MKVIIAGSRTITDYGRIRQAMAAFTQPYPSHLITEIVSGGCLGIDLLGEKWARLTGIPVKRFLPDWTAHGRGAGPIRNRIMAEYADALVAVWDGVSAGTASMINEMQKLNKPVYVNEGLANPDGGRP